jgi:hypothetical protein
VRDFEQLLGTGCSMMETVSNQMTARATRISCDGNNHMLSWLKKHCALRRPLFVRLIYRPATLVAATILLASTALSQSFPGGPEVSANEMVRRVITNELKFQAEDQAQWTYLQEKEESGKKQVKRIIETRDGALSRLLSTNDQPLTAKEQQEENQRIQELVGNPAEQRKLQQAQNIEAEPGRRLFKMLPAAFVFSYAGRVGDLTKLSFRPNPSFRPPSLEARVFHDMEGEIWVDVKQERLAAINGRLTEDAKFGGGLLGHLNKGGHFEVKRAEVAPGHWEMAVMAVVMQGKALLFKTINVNETETRSDFQRVLDDLTLTQAADILNRQIVVAASR